MAIDTGSIGASSIIQSLQVGSGIDTRALAKGLAEAENQGRIDTVSSRKVDVETSISGYGILKSSIDSLRYAFDALKDTRNLVSTTASAFPPELQMTVTGAGVTDGDHVLQIEQLARKQITVLPVLSFDDVGSIASISVAGTELNPSAGTSATALVDSINAADTGVFATLVNRMSLSDPDGDGAGELVDGWVIVLQGGEGSAAAFDVEVEGVGVEATQSARDARITFDGVTVQRSSNEISDLLGGAVFDLRNASAGTAYRVTTRTDFSPLKTSLQELASVYNDIGAILDELVSIDSDASEYSGSLSRDKSLVSSVRGELKKMFDKVSATGSGEVETLRDLGFSFALDGTLELDEDVLDARLSAGDTAVVAMLAGTVAGQSRYSAADTRGLGLEISLRLEDMIGSNGLVQPRIETAKSRISSYDDQLVVLEERLQAAYQRYVQQFAAMESFVQRSKDIGTYLEGQFKAMENTYKD